jgi:hypothetical protein
MQISRGLFRGAALSPARFKDFWLGYPTPAFTLCRRSVAAGLRTSGA